MGLVHEAEQERPVRRRVALKLIRTDPSFSVLHDEPKLEALAAEIDSKIANE